MRAPISNKGMPSLPQFGMWVGAVTTGMAGATVTYGQGASATMPRMQTAAMTPQDQAFIEARMDAKMADMRTDVKLNTQGLSDLRQRFDEFVKRMDGVPTQVATITERVSHLPTKDELSTKLRNYTLLGVALLGLLISAATLFLRFAPVAKVATT